ncbi:hypothetical protein B0H11DRAFT_2094171 [Mycena galericulata]|nr:hypothetical protein B0H11DRAFT_2094171 [Mycena galericulata]
MDSTSQAPALIPTNTSYAIIVTPQLIGSLLNFFFFGMLLVQSYIYRLCFPKDTLGMKFIVYFILLATTVCTCLNAADVEFWFGTGFGDIARFDDPRNSRIYTPLLGSLIAMLVQIFFSLRIASMRTWPISVLVFLIAMLQCAGGMGTGILSYMDAAAVHDTKRTVFVYLWLIGGAAVDLLIAVIMAILILKTPTAPRDVVKTVVRLVVETNALSAIAALLGLILYVGVPNTTYWICPTMVLPAMYVHPFPSLSFMYRTPRRSSANTLLLALNHRRAVSEIENLSAASPVYHTTSALRNANSNAIGARSAPVYSASSPGRVLNVPAMSFKRREDETTARGRSSMEKKWSDEPDSDSDYGSDAEDRV